MIHHYLHKGHSLNELMNLSLGERQFLIASLNLYHEEQATQWET